MKILSILIPTTPDRAEMFSSLFTEVHRQIQYMETFHPTLGEIEVIVDDSKLFLEGGLSIGKKREELVKRAEGKYLCFLDSDDFISPAYVESIVRLCRQNMDVCTFRSIAKMDNYWMIVDMSLAHKENDQPTPLRMIKRKPWHVCAIRSSHAKLFPFDDINYGEDSTWMERVLTMCKGEARSEEILHEYRHGKHSESDKITLHESLTEQ